LGFGVKDLRRKYFVLDVFTDRPLAGNPLAVVIDCDGLDDSVMQAIAREFNLSETVFVLQPRDAVNTARIRIFTPVAELPFAGHPTIGAAVLIGELRAADLMRTQDVGIVLEEKIGKVSCAVRHAPGKCAHARFILPNLPSRTGVPKKTEEVAAALSLEPADIGFGRHVPSIYSAGFPFTFVPVASQAALARARPRLDLFDETFADSAKTFLYTREVEDAKHDFQARMFAPSFGVFEDPATGSAAAAFSGVLMAFDKMQTGRHDVMIEQGYQMGRPSLIGLSLDIEHGVLVEASIGGNAIITAEGALAL
jgi:trans-2,3-dihydro-3-hydroxyanthranilate isomerase